KTETACATVEGSVNITGSGVMIDWTLSMNQLIRTGLKILCMVPSMCFLNNKISHSNLNLVFHLANPKCTYQVSS
ncbi:MAG: hypothetical protein MPI47_09375, partial [Cuniculiplasma sp.]|nr:hypothetical protein [Cuniculiplasma sp.]